jgi:acyl carrier protein
MVAMTLDDVHRTATANQQLYDSIKTMIVERLELDFEPEWISEDQPLFGRGLELDSVDTLELIVGIESRNGVAHTDDDTAAFGSIARLADRLSGDLDFTGV